MAARRFPSPVSPRALLPAHLRSWCFASVSGTYTTPLHERAAGDFLAIRGYVGGDELLRAALRAHRAHQPSSRRELVHERLRQGGCSGAHVYGVERPAVLRVPEPTVRRRERDDAVVEKPRFAVGAEVFF